jgi:predicted nucleotidyltransferase
MTESSIDLSNRRELAIFAEVIAAVLAHASATQVLIVGATARDLLLTYGHGLEIARGTTDIDFAMAVADWAEFDRIRASLIESGEFKPAADGLHRLKHRNGIPVDIVPFDGVEDEDRQIAWPPQRDLVMKVLGYREALAAAVKVRMPGGFIVNVVSLPALAIMKLVAWTERRHTAPKKDAYDLWLLLRTYSDAGNQERLYSGDLHLLEVESFDYESAGAWLLGADARDVIERSHDPAEAVATLDGILAPEIDREGKLRLVADINPQDPAKALDVLAAFRQGFQRSHLS